MESNKNTTKGLRRYWVLKVISINNWLESSSYTKKNKSNYTLSGLEIHVIKTARKKTVLQNQI